MLMSFLALIGTRDWWELRDHIQSLCMIKGWEERCRENKVIPLVPFRRQFDSASGARYR